MLELYQAEWCPHSHTVRERLTELGIDFVARQVEAEPEDREVLQERAGTDEIPVLVDDDGTVTSGEDAILELLGRRAKERDDAATHRRKSEDKVEEFAG
ncbi:MAG TPA: glutaredoxin domain-containing protein [Thermoleophilaceae bacterium]|jgi:glutaredoxin